MQRLRKKRCGLLCMHAADGEAEAAEGEKEMFGMPSGKVKTVLTITDMQCPMCEAHINEAIRKAFDVKKIMEDHGGKIWVTRKEGIGTVMYLVLRKYQEVPVNE